MGYSLVSKFFPPLNPQPTTVPCGWRAIRSADRLSGLCCPLQRRCGLGGRGKGKEAGGSEIQGDPQPTLSLTSCVSVPAAPSSDSRDGALGRRRLCGTRTHPWSPGEKRLPQPSAHCQGPRRDPPAASVAHISATVDADQVCDKICASQSPLSRCISASEVPFRPLYREGPPGA